MNRIVVNPLLEPLPGDDIGGIDLTFSAVFDEIREARREDDASLTQGEWETDLKSAQWLRVKELSEEVLCRQSKDLQVAAWHTEAIARLEGFAGLAVGLRLMEGLLSDFWEFCYPPWDPEDLDERAGKIEWLNRQLPLVIRQIPLTDRAAGAYCWLRWEESRATDNLGLRDPAARDKAVAAGKLSGEAFDKAVQSSGRGYFERLHAHAKDALLACVDLERRVDERFGANSPSLKDTRQAIEACDELVGKLLARLGGKSEEQTMPKSTALRAEDFKSLRAIGASTATPFVAGTIANRGDAVRALREAASYFRVNEPHSPVALLAERAASWAEMPLDEWLAAVVKDQGTLSQLRELLDIREKSAS